MSDPLRFDAEAGTIVEIQEVQQMNFFEAEVDEDGIVRDPKNGATLNPEYYSVVEEVDE